jgi:hypothetical protein
MALFASSGSLRQSHLRLDDGAIEVDAAAGTSGAVAITSSLGLVSSMPFSIAKAVTSLASIAYPLSS